MTGRIINGFVQKGVGTGNWLSYVIYEWPQGCLVFLHSFDLLSPQCLISAMLITFITIFAERFADSKRTWTWSDLGGAARLAEIILAHLLNYIRHVPGGIFYITAGHVLSNSDLLIRRQRDSRGSRRRPEITVLTL